MPLLTQNHKRRTRKVVTPAVGEILECRALLSAIYINSDSGSDENTGRFRTPLATIQAGLDLAASLPGHDVVIVEDSAAGYHENLTIHDQSGSVKLIARRDTLVTVHSTQDTAGLTIQDSEYVYVRNLRFVDSTASGIHIDAQKSVTLKNVHATNNHDGIVVTGSGVTRFVDVSASANANNGLHVSGTEKSTVVRGEFNHNGRTGYTVADTTWSRAHIVEATHNGRRGMLVDEADTTFVRFGQFDHNAHDGLKAYGVTTRVHVRESSASNNAHDGFDVSHSTLATFYDVTASGNIFDGLEVDDLTDRLSVRIGEFHGNGSEGITADTVNRVVLRETDSRENGSDGIDLRTVERASLHKIQSHGNLDDSRGIGFNDVARLSIYQADISGHTGSGVEGFSSGVVALKDVRIFENAKNGPGGGLHVSDAERVIVRNSEIRHNSASDGGGIFVNDLAGKLVVRESDVSHNTADSGNAYGGGIRTDSPTWIVRTEVSENVATGWQASGAGIYATGDAVIRISTSTVANNQAAGYLSSRGKFSYAFGGGVFVGLGAKASFYNATISGNSADMDMSTGPEDTIYRVRGGGIYKNSAEGTTVHLNHSTVAFNHALEGGGIYGYGDGTTVRNSIVTDNSAGVWANVNDQVESRGHNISDGVLDHSTDVIDAAFLLELADNGGPTRTHAVRDDSPTIDAASSRARTDQRGMDRVLPDIGAFEFDVTSDAD